MLYIDIGGWSDMASKLLSCAKCSESKIEIETMADRWDFENIGLYILYASQYRYLR